MEKLKTLKDFEIEAQKDVDNPGSYAWMNEANYEKEQGEGKLHLVKDLRQEAIKWIKAFRIELLKYKNCKFGSSGWIAKESLKSRILLFKDFFNITEEDLK